MENNWIWDRIWNYVGLSTSEDVFIGFTDENVEGQWEWMNGDSVLFSYFGYDEGPNNTNNSTIEDFCAINYGGNLMYNHGFSGLMFLLVLDTQLLNLTLIH